MFSKRNTGIKCEQCRNFTIMTTEPHQLTHSAVLIVDFEHTEHNFTFILPVDFEKVNIGYLGS